MKNIVKVLLIGALVTFLVGCENTQDCDYCNDIHEKIRHERTVEGLNEIMKNYDCPNCH